MAIEQHRDERAACRGQLVNNMDTVCRTRIYNQPRTRRNGRRQTTTPAANSSKEDRLTVCHQPLGCNVQVRRDDLERRRMRRTHRLDLGLALLRIRYVVLHPLRDHLREPMPVDQHAHVLLQTVQPLRLRHPDHVIARHCLDRVRPVRRDRAADVVEERLLFSQLAPPPEPRQDRVRAGEERRGLGGGPTWLYVEDRLHHDEDANGVHERAHPALGLLRLQPDAVAGDELVVDNGGLGHVAVAQTQHRWSAKVCARLLVPQVDAPEGTFPDLVLDRIEQVVVIRGAVEATVEGERDSLRYQGERFGEPSEANSVHTRNEHRLDGVQRRLVRTRKCA